MSDLKVRDVMTTKLVTVHQDDTIKQATLKFAIAGISGAPVVDDENRLVGILSETDILELVMKYQDKLRMEHPSLHILSLPFDSTSEMDVKEVVSRISETPVKEVMTRAVLTVSPDARIIDTVERMIEKKVNRVPVIEKDKLVGIVTRGDIIFAFYRNKGG
ncbi:MAG: hypothetical protein PWQ88_1253 [Candidatus Methanomethylophilaceae archaeon]|jgi:CBS-domain-containing membrane protein|nr:hypothetical protein [Candidatus Methanomethylophilaceae archaeon]MDI3541182.1 hypothetical protein [Candidatus Methanomethylophilaceae archaeon]